MRNISGAKCSDEDGHRHGIGEIERAVHVERVCVDVDRPPDRKRRVQHRQ